MNSPGRESKTVAAGPTAALSIRRGLSADAIAQALIDNLHCLQAKPPQHATRNDWYMALAYTVRDRMLDRYITTLERSRARAATPRSWRISRPSS